MLYKGQFFKFVPFDDNGEPLLPTSIETAFKEIEDIAQSKVDLQSVPSFRCSLCNTLQQSSVGCTQVQCTGRTMKPVLFVSHSTATMITVTVN